MKRGAEPNLNIFRELKKLCIIIIGALQFNYLEDLTKSDFPFLSSYRYDEVFLNLEVAENCKAIRFAVLLLFGRTAGSSRWNHLEKS